MDENTPSIWLTGILEQPPATIMGDGTSTIQFDLIIDGPTGPSRSASKRPEHPMRHSSPRDGRAKATASSSTAGSTTTMTEPDPM